MKDNGALFEWQNPYMSLYWKAHGEEVKKSSTSHNTSHYSARREKRDYSNTFTYVGGRAHVVADWFPVMDDGDPLGMGPAARLRAQTHMFYVPGHIADKSCGMMAEDEW